MSDHNDQSHEQPPQEEQGVTVSSPASEQPSANPSLVKNLSSKVPNTPQKFLATFGKIDRFATEPSLNYRGSKHYTFVGVTISFFIYCFLAGYLFYKLNQAFNDPQISSYTLVGQLEDELDFSATIVCLDDAVTTFDSNYDVNAVFYVSNTPNLKFKRTYLSGMTSGICGNFIGFSNISTNYPILIGVDHSKFSQSSVTYNIYYQYIAFNPDEIKVPTIVSRKSYVQNKASLQSFLLNFEKAQYKINRSPLSVGQEKSECPIFSTIEQNSATTSDKVIQLRYTAKKTVYDIKCNTIPSVLSDIVGLRDTLTTIIALALAKFFELKYYENLANSFKPASQKLRAGFWAFIGCGKKGNDNKAISDEIKREQEFIESKLDVMTYLGSYIKERDIEVYKASSPKRNKK